MARFDAKLNEEIRRTFRNFNSKVRRNKTKTRGRGMLPLRVSIKEFKEKYSDKPRAEILRQLKIYQSFGSREMLDTATENSRLSKWERAYFRRNMGKTKRFFDKEIKEMQEIVGNKPEYHLRQDARLTNLLRQREQLNKDLNTLTEDEIKTMRTIFTYAERSELAKQKGFRLYLSQLERTMKILGYSKEEIDGLFNTFNVLTENEFFNMMQNEDLVDTVYDIIDSPKKRGQYQLMTDENRARGIVTDIMNQAGALVAKYKVHK